jgi:quinol monooxygenase YgiN
MAPAKQFELMQAIGGLKQEIALEIGCISCRFYQNTENSCEFIVSEEWENEKSARAHL